MEVYTYFFFFLIFQEFDIAAQLDTVPELVDRLYNRPTIATLQREAVKGPTDPVQLKVLLLFVLQSSSWFTSFIWLKRINCTIVEVNIIVFLKLLLTQGSSGCQSPSDCLEPAVTPSPGPTCSTLSLHPSPLRVDHHKKKSGVDLIRQCPCKTEIFLLYKGTYTYGSIFLLDCCSSRCNFFSALLSLPSHFSKTPFTPELGV